VGRWESEAILASPGRHEAAVGSVPGQHGGLGEQRGGAYVCEQYAYGANK
jgi:hypothetical protein